MAVRQRQQFDVTLHLTPNQVMAVSAYARYRTDDFDSDVEPSQPLLVTRGRSPSGSAPRSISGTSVMRDMFRADGPEVQEQAVPTRA